MKSIYTLYKDIVAVRIRQQMVKLQLTLFSDKTHTISAASKLSSLKYLHATELRSHS